MTELSGLRWAAAAVYVLGALLALRAASRSASRERTFWFGTGLILILLGLAKGMHVQDDVTNAVRGAAMAGGWYDWHQGVQALFAIIAGTAFMAVGLVLARWLGGSSSAAKAAAATLCALLAVLAIRATSIHAVDSWAMQDLGGLRRGWWIELAAVATIALAAISREQR